jgi:Erv1/Alr family protein
MGFHGHEIVMEGVAPATPQSPRSDDPGSDPMAERGPDLWREVHCWALSTDRKDVSRWLARFEIRIGCGECRRHWQAILNGQPPEISSNETLFAWSVHMHNAVNRQLNKPEMAVDAARTFWTDTRCRQTLTAVGASSDQPPRRKGPCAGCGGNKTATQSKKEARR